MCASSCVPNISNEQGAFCQGVDAAALLLLPLLLLLPPLLLLLPPLLLVLPMLLLLLPPRLFPVCPSQKKNRSRSKARVLGPARKKAGLRTRSSSWLSSLMSVLVGSRSAEVHQVSFERGSTKLSSDLSSSGLAVDVMGEIPQVAQAPIPTGGRAPPAPISMRSFSQNGYGLV